MTDADLIRRYAQLIGETIEFMLDWARIAVAGTNMSEALIGDPEFATPEKRRASLRAYLRMVVEGSLGERIRRAGR